jgi:SAM-dependent methyltransferase
VGFVTVDQALADTRHAFDGVASGYHESNERNPILRAMRARARTVLQRFVLPHARILDLGCGPGTDIVPLAQAGYDVTGIDCSPAMVAEAQRRIDDAGVRDRARVRHLGIHQLPQLASVKFDGAYSNFGAFNCVADLARAANDLAACLRPHARLVATVIGRLCPWEVALYLTRGSWSRAAVRFGRQPVAVPLDGRTVWTRYYTPGEFARIFGAAGFTREFLRSLSCAAPPPYLEAFARRHPSLIRELHQIDDVVGSWPFFRSCGDHFLIVMRRL